MDKQIIITLGREFGSGGHQIAEKLAERLGITLLDRVLIDRVVEEKGYEEKLVEKYDEKGVGGLFSQNVNGYTNSISDYVAQAEFDIIRRDAEAGMSFIVVGRCAEDILQDYPNVISIFIRAEMDFKMRRIVDQFNISSDKALSLMKKTDRERKYYHNYYCKEKWGDSRAYDITINSSMLGLEKTIDVLEYMIRQKLTRL